jgi:hypothetical protein
MPITLEVRPIDMMKQAIDAGYFSKDEIREYLEYHFKKKLLPHIFGRVLSNLKDYRASRMAKNLADKLNSEVNGLVEKVATIEQKYGISPIAPAQTVTLDQATIVAVKKIVEEFGLERVQHALTVLGWLAE